ncbi:TPA: methyl-accepting chemotaxis protein, partial [Stenotrophomonas maltophilia]|nr:methyl-accepting chemotaxis protein [Stenotrophomonas maltophilia]HDS1122417.1 methyl-accepting chemotaxis protein [Stenotrophomonas maltophilia]
EATAAARAMEEQAGHLSEAVSIFVVDEAEAVVAPPRAVAPAARAATPAAPAPVAPPARRTAGGRPMATELADGDWQEF